MNRPLLFGALGVLLLGLGQTLTLVHLRPLSDSWYPIVWFGYVLLVDSFLLWRSGVSLIHSRRADFVWMIVAGAGLWWTFELLNLKLFSSWDYSPSPDIPLWFQRLRASVAFSSLLPATWESALLALWLWERRSPERRDVSLRGDGIRWWLVAAMAAGGALLALSMILRALALPLGLVGIFFLLDGINGLVGRPSILAELRARRWAMPISFFLGNVAVGFLGEAWNYPADPKWTYHVPYASFWYVFEMPLPGYLGYGFLALTLFAAYHAVRLPRLGSTRKPTEEGDVLARTGLVAGRRRADA